MTSEMVTHASGLGEEGEITIDQGRSSETSVMESDGGRVADSENASKLMGWLWGVVMEDG